VASHGVYTEPSTGITFYTSNQANGTITGDGDESRVSLGGFTFGMALPGNALTVNSYEYIGLIVSCETHGIYNLLIMHRLVPLRLGKEDGLVFFKEAISEVALLCQIISCS
jgi:hypothetical protein